MHIGLKVKQLVQRRGDTYDEAAKRIGTAGSNVFNATKKADLHTSFLRKVAEAYGVPLRSFFNDEEINTPNIQQLIANESGAVYGSIVANCSQTVELQKKEIEIQGLKTEVSLLREMVEILKKS